MFFRTCRSKTLSKIQKNQRNMKGTKQQLTSKHGIKLLKGFVLHRGDYDELY